MPPYALQKPEFGGDDHENEEAEILIVHLMVAVVAGILLAFGSLLAGFSGLTSLVAYVVGANCGLALSVWSCAIQLPAYRHRKTAAQMEA
jgi:hypothetical protein